MRRLTVLGVALVLAGCTSTPTPSSTSNTPSTVDPPKFDVQVVAGGLEHGWDIGFLPDGKVLITERPAKLALVSGTRPGATVTTVDADLSDVFVDGEAGLLGMVLHPDFATSHLFTTCQDYKENGQPSDIRLVTWRLSDDERSATKVRDLLTGLPISPSGRHSGCRPTIAHDGSLLVGTGDTANASVSQDKRVLGGKVLRLDLATGGPAPGNPFADQPSPTNLIYTYGHRNVQGVAPRPDSDQVFTVEHGPDKNDEVNLLVAGANYGWDPSRGGTVGGYDENVPMTDLTRFPDAVPAKWESGATTEATCAAVFLSGPQWRQLDGALVVTALKGAKLIVFTLDKAGTVLSTSIPPEFTEKYGRLRAARQGPDGALYVTTSNGTDDKLLRISLA